VDNSAIAEFLRSLDDRIGRIEAHLTTLAQPRGAVNEYLSIKEAAAHAGLSPTKIRREIKAGRLPACDTGTLAHPHYRISRADFQTWIERHRGGAMSPPQVPVHKRKVMSRYFGQI
jgi:excisionase family DNA binding protein